LTAGRRTELSEGRRERLLAAIDPRRHGVQGPVLWALLGVVAVAVALAFAWLVGQELPQGARDEFFIVEAATDLAYRLRAGAGWGEVDLWILHTYYPPLTRAPGVVALLLGGGYDAMIVAQWLLWLPMLVAGTFSIGRRLGGSPRAGLFAVALLLFAAAIVDCMHRFESNLGATASAACFVAAWLASDDFRNRRASLLAGLFLGLGLMSDRLGVLPFALLPLGLSLARTRGRGCWKGIAGAAVVATLLCGWWYASFFGRFAQELIPQLLGGEITALGEVIGERPPALWYWLHYVVLWPDSQFGLVAGLLAVASLVWAVARFERRPVADTLLFVAAGLLLFTLVPKRQTYYTMPLLPAVAAMAAAMLQELAKARPKAGLAAVVALLVLAAAPTALNVRAGLLDFDRGLASWLLLGQSPIRDDLVAPRYPLGVAPADHGVAVDEVIAALEQAGVGRSEPIAAFSFDSQVSESFLVSLLRIERRNFHTQGVSLHPDQLVQGPAPRALVHVHRGDDPWPSNEDVIEAFRRFRGWDEGHRPVLTRLDELRRGATLLDQRPLAAGDSIDVWLLTP
jgi:hypothetical protein